MTNDVDEAAKRGQHTEPGTPRWVKVFGAIAVLVIVLAAVMLLSGGHGPNRHAAPALVGIE